MKKLLLLASTFMLMAGIATAQNCCKRPTGMQALALNTEFKDSHLAPLPYTYDAEDGSMVSYPTPDKATSSAFYLPAKHVSNKVLIVVHEWWGLNDYIKKEAANLQESLGGDIDVYAIDLYDGVVATTADEAGKQMGKLSPLRGKAIIEGLLQKIGKDKQVATIGWCMGGSWSFTAAVLAGSQTKACVMYYGFPETDMAKIKPLKADVLYVRGTEDGFIKKEDVAKFGKAVQSLGVKYTQKDYPAVHAFANPSNPKYDVKSATAAKEVTLKFLKAHLGIK